MRRFSATVLAVGILFAARASSGFTQWGGDGIGTAVGHEFITIQSAKEVYAAVVKAGVAADTKHYAPLAQLDLAAVQQLAKANRGAFVKLVDLDLLPRVFGWMRMGYFWSSSPDPVTFRGLYAEYYQAVLHDTKSIAAWSAAVGQRWVDTMGFSYPRFKQCFLAVPQETDEFQHDHFLRSLRDWDLVKGRTDAYKGAMKRLKSLFLRAVKAADDLIPMTDASATRENFMVMRSFFLLGHAFHLLQDSFSTEHSLRTHNHKEVIEIKTYYTTTPWLPAHTHDAPISARGSNHSHGDIIWGSVAFKWTVNNLKRTAVAALEASQDLWKAFFEARKPKANPGGLFDTLVEKKWFVLGSRITVKAKLEAALRGQSAATLAKLADQPTNAKAIAENLLLGYYDHRTGKGAKRRECLKGTGRLALMNWNPSAPRDPDVQKPPYFWVWGQPKENVKVHNAFWP